LNFQISGEDDKNGFNLVEIKEIICNIRLKTQVEMAHKVLSKDMSELVHAMKLVQKYLNTTVEGNYHK
jgi:hypothetical protein